MLNIITKTRMKMKQIRIKKLAKQEWINKKLWKKFFAFQKFKSNEHKNNEEGA